jgi:hypothetical protein
VQPMGHAADEALQISIIRQNLGLSSNEESLRTNKLYDCTGEEITLDEVGQIAIPGKSGLWR